MSRGHESFHEKALNDTLGAGRIGRLLKEEVAHVPLVVCDADLTWTLRENELRIGGKTRELVSKQNFPQHYCCVCMEALSNPIRLRSARIWEEEFVEHLSIRELTCLH